MESIAIIDRYAQLAGMKAIISKALGCQVLDMRSGEEAVQYIVSGKQACPDLLLFDMERQEKDAYDTIRLLKSRCPHVPVVALVPYGEEDVAVQAVREGASDYLAKPLSLERLRVTVQNTMRIRQLSDYVEWLKRKIGGDVMFNDMIGDNAAFREAMTRAAQTASSKMPVWIEGETGTGKEMLARAIHNASDRSGQPFVAVNCQSLSEDVLETLLFGQEQETNFNKMQFVFGKLSEADRGTLYLEEVRALKPQLQHRLTSALYQDRKDKAVDVRLICCSSQPRDQNVHGMFDPKLYQRLNGVMIEMPPLRARGEDIEKLAQHFLSMHMVSEGKFCEGFTPAALRWIHEQSWPGNVRQLSHIVWRALLLSGQPQVDVKDLQATHALQARATSDLLLDEKGHVKKLKSIEAEAIRYAVNSANGCMTRAARNLGIGRSTLYRKVSELGIDQRKIAG